MTRERDGKGRQDTRQAGCGLAQQRVPVPARSRRDARVVSDLALRRIRPQRQRAVLRPVRRALQHRPAVDGSAREPLCPGPRGRTQGSADRICRDDGGGGAAVRRRSAGASPAHEHRRALLGRRRRLWLGHLDARLLPSQPAHRLALRVLVDGARVGGGIPRRLCAARRPADRRHAHAPRRAALPTNG